MRKDLFDRGKTEFNAGRYEKAARLFLAAIKQDKETPAGMSSGVFHSKPEDHRAWNALSQCFLRLGQKKKAIQCIKNAIQLDPRNKQYRRSLHNMTKRSLFTRLTWSLKKLKIFWKDTIWNPILKITRNKRLLIPRFRLKRVRSGITNNTSSNFSTRSSTSGPHIRNEEKNLDSNKMHENFVRGRIVGDDLQWESAEKRRNAEDEEIEELIALDII